MPRLLLQCPVVPVRWPSFYFTQGWGGQLGLAVPWDLASVRSWRSQAEVDWPSPREGHIMAAPAAGSFSTSLLPPRQRHPHSPLGWWKCLWLRPWLCGWLTWKFWGNKIWQPEKGQECMRHLPKLGLLIKLGSASLFPSTQGGREMESICLRLPLTTYAAWRELSEKTSVSAFCFWPVFYCLPARLLFYCLYSTKHQFYSLALCLLPACVQPMYQLQLIH